MRKEKVSLRKRVKGGDENDGVCCIVDIYGTISPLKLYTSLTKDSPKFATCKIIFYESFESLVGLSCLNFLFGFRFCWNFTIELIVGQAIKCVNLTILLAKWKSKWKYIRLIRNYLQKLNQTIPYFLWR